ncbi:MAG TPA: SRPBCC family protein [Candidatus Limnocylindrales bacterium]
MTSYVLTTHVDATPEVTFDLWTDIGRMAEWVRGATKVSEPDGPIDLAGTRYAAWFGGMRSDTMVIEAERPRVFATRFGSRILRGTNRATFEPDATGTRLTQAFQTDGVVAAFFAWVFGHGSYRGSFRGELEAFAQLAARESQGGVR